MGKGMNTPSIIIDHNIYCLIKDGTTTVYMEIQELGE